MFCTLATRKRKFQHTAARRRLGEAETKEGMVKFVSTHSRPKAAGALTKKSTSSTAVSTHSRPKAAGAAESLFVRLLHVSTHSRPKAAGA